MIFMAPMNELPEGRMKSGTARRPDTPSAKVLVVDDDALVRRLLVRSLQGCEVVTASTGAEAADLVKQHDFDVVVSDVEMPGMSGLQLLQCLRETNPDLPVLLVTGSPNAAHTSDAVRYGATSYLTKPLDPGAIAAEVGRASQLHALSRLRRQAADLARQPNATAGDPEKLAQWGRAVEGLFMVYQPIVRWSTRGLYAHEALVRTTEPTVPHPGVLLELAEGLGTLPALGRQIRSIVSGPLDDAPDGSLLFVNLHSRDLEDEQLFAGDSPLAQISSRVVFEITERADLSGIDDPGRRIADLKKLGFRVAVDDIGAGYAGLNSFVTLAPDLVKLDMTLVRDIDSDPLRRRLVRSLVDLCADLAIDVVAEGIETPAERDTLVELGCDLFQGFLFARPSLPFQPPTF